MVWNVLRTVTDGSDFVIASDHNDTKNNFEVLGGSDGNTKTGPYTIASTLTVSTGGASITGNVIVSSGSVGIGTSSPAYTLDVNGHTRFPNNYAIHFNDPSGTARRTVHLASTGYFYIGDVDNFTGSRLYLRGKDYVHIDVDTVTRVTVDNTGKVGIGTSSPTATLHVVGDVNIAPTTGGAYHTIRGIQAGQNAHQYFYTSNALKWVQYANDSNSRLYFLDADSNDGVYIAQNTTSWTSNSDSRLKDVQGTITDALAKVGQLTGVKFTWKRDADNPDAKVRVGLIAQDVQAVLPEAVDDESPDLITDEETGKVSGGLGVRYTEVVPLLVNAIKELTARVVTLEAQIANA